jgi:hypothetical protein
MADMGQGNAANVDAGNPVLALPCAAPVHRQTRPVGIFYGGEVRMGANAALEIATLATDTLNAKYTLPERPVCACCANMPFRVASRTVAIGPSPVNKLTAGDLRGLLALFVVESDSDGGSSDVRKFMRTLKKHCAESSAGQGGTEGFPATGGGGGGGAGGGVDFEYAVLTLARSTCQFSSASLSNKYSAGLKLAGLLEQSRGRSCMEPGWVRYIHISHAAPFAPIVFSPDARLSSANCSVANAASRKWS